jgi:hypothetical protein
MANRRRRRIDSRDPAQGLPVWRWRTLPVYLALTGGFVVGWYVAAFSGGLTFDNFGQILPVWIVLMAFSLGLSRVVARYTAIWAAKRRAAKSEKRILSNPASTPSRRSGQR